MDLKRQLDRAIAGDRSALRAVVVHYEPQIRRWALVCVGDPVLADDAIQEALIRLIRRIGQYDPARPFGPWLKALVCNAARNEAAKARTQEDPPPAPGPHPCPPPGRRIDLERASQRALAAFAHLSPRQREILDLVDLQGETPTEVAAQLGLTPGAVRGQLFQARRAVRAHLVDHDAILPLLREA